MNSTTEFPDRDFDDPGGILTAGMTVIAAKFPVPNTDGLSPTETEAVLNRWRAEVFAYQDALEARLRARALRK